MENSYPRKIFGTDGVRGRANITPMTVETALALGRAAGKALRQHFSRPKVVVGKDTRLSCYMFENALIAGLCSMGVDTLMVGPLPTPGVAFITRAYRAAAGVMISASHNPYYDNGIKFFTSEGYKQPDEWEATIEQWVRVNDYSSALPQDQELGRNSKVVDADGRYIEFVKATFPKNFSLKNVSIALDCANGAGYKVAPLVFQELDATLFVIGNKPDGLNINLGCGSLHTENVQKAVIERHADIGIALDGDADRVIMIDENAQIVDGDAILTICAADMKRRGVLKNNSVVATVMSNIGFVKAIEEMGISVHRAPVGDRYVIQEMLEHDSNLGGEQSGHLIFLDHNTTGDGLVGALQVLRIMKETGSRLSDLCNLYHKYPQVCVNVKISSKPPLDSLKATQIAIQDITNKLGDNGRVLVRYSGTEDICRVMVEGPKQKLVNEYASGIAAVIEQEIASANNPSKK